MYMQLKTIPCLILISCFGLLAGCTTGRVPQKGPTMAQIYKEAMAAPDSESIQSLREQTKVINNYEGRTDYSGYTRIAQNEVSNLFKPLPNPQMVMYVYPHIVADDEAPIPGYSTAFYLFEQNHYALPGEVS